MDIYVYVSLSCLDFKNINLIIDETVCFFQFEIYSVDFLHILYLTKHDNSKQDISKFLHNPAYIYIYGNISSGSTTIILNLLTSYIYLYKKL